MKVLLPYPPSNNRYFRNFRGRMVISADGRTFKAQAAWACRAAGFTILTGDIELQVIFHPKLTKAGKASKTRLDLDNIFKPICDCLNGVAYVDDSQIVKIGAVIGDPWAGGGVTVIVDKCVKLL